MKSILFLDDWMVEHRDSLERVWGKPRFVKEIIQEFYPGFLGYAGYISCFYDANVGRYVMYLAVLPPRADPDVFVTRLESDDPYNWDSPTYDTSVSPAWKGFQNVVVDQDGRPFWPFSVFPLRVRLWRTRGMQQRSGGTLGTFRSWRPSRTVAVS